MNRTFFAFGLALFALASLFFMPRVVSLLLVFAATPLVPAAPLAAGILADALYLAPGAYAWPLYTLLGALATVIAFFVRSRLNP